MRRLGSIAASVTLAGAILADVAVGGGEGLRYGTSLEAAVDGAATGAEAACAAGELLGGGVGVTGEDEDLEVGSTEPLFSDWAGVVNNTSGVEETMSVHAICDSSVSPGFTEVVRKDQEVPAHDERAAQARCPGGRKVAGGGVGTGVDDVLIEVASTAPFDANDPDPTPENGWRGIVNNETSSAVTMRVWAVCAKKYARYRYFSEKRSLPAHGNKQFTKPCNEDLWVVGGGVRVAGLHRGLEISETRPRIGGESVDAWIGGANNETNKDREMKVFVICGDPFGAGEPPD